MRASTPSGCSKCDAVAKLIEQPREIKDGANAAHAVVATGSMHPTKGFAPKPF
jgi:hypothetical protein